MSPTLSPKNGERMGHPATGWERFDQSIQTPRTSLLRYVPPAAPAASRADAATAPQADTAVRERTPGTASPTSPARRAQTDRVRGLARLGRCGQANPAHATSPQTAAPAAARRRRAHRSRCRNLPPCRTARAPASNSPAQADRDTAPCSARTESDRAAEFRWQCVPAATPEGSRSQLPVALELRNLFFVLRRADKHLDDVIMQAVEDLPLQGPLELRIVQIARVQVEVVGVNAWFGEARPDDELHSFALFARVKGDERVLVQPQLFLHVLQAGVHRAIVTQW